jgi:dTDP-4-amino-4,6-dideoxygalactose transaminase
VTRRPDELIASLHERVVQTGRHYPKTPHLTQAYAHLASSFPVAGTLAVGCVSLPISPGVGDEEVDAVIHDFP